MAILKYKNTDGTWEIFESPGAVKYFEQNLTDEEKAQARANIGAASDSDLDALSTLVGEKPVSEQINEAITEIGLPEITEADDGKILGVVGDAWAITDAPESESILPKVTTDDNGMFLGVKEGAWDIVPAPEGSGGSTAITELPEVTVEDNGKVLGVIDGAWQKMDVEVSGGGNSSSVQSDYTQNDETADDYIKNRPFYVGNAVMTEVLPTTTLPFTYSENDNAYIFTFTPTPEQLATWQSEWVKTELTWDETMYTCEPQYFMGIKCIGNIGLMTGGSNNDMPFIFMMADASSPVGADICMIYSLFDTPPEDTTVESTVYHNIAMSMEIASVITLDPKFLSEVPWDKVTNKPFGDIPSGTVLFDETVSCTMQEGETTYIGFATFKNKFPEGTYDVEWNGSYCTGTMYYSGYTPQMTMSNGDNEFGIIMPEMGYVLSKTYGDVVVKIIANKDMVVKIDSKYLPDIGSGLPDSTTSDNGKVLTVGSDGAATWQTPAIPEVEDELPVVTTNDVGKFLRVSVDGLWVAESVPNAEEASF